MPMRPRRYSMSGNAFARKASLTESSTTSLSAQLKFSASAVDLTRRKGSKSGQTFTVDIETVSITIEKLFSL